MKALIIIGCILLAVWLISLVRIGGAVEYSEGGLTVRARLGPFSFRVFPLGEKKPKAEKKKKETKRKPAGEGEPPEPKRGGDFALVKEILPLAAEAAGRFKRKIRVDRLYLDFTSGGADPAKAAMAFGYANVALGMIWPLLEHNFHIKDRRIRTAVDFQRASPILYLYAVCSLTIGQAAALGVALAVKFLKIYSRHREKSEEIKKEAVSNVGT